MKKQPTKRNMAQLKSEFYRLVTKELFSQKDAASRVGISRVTACHWYMDIMASDDVDTNQRFGNSSYSHGEVLLYKEQLAILLMQKGKTQKQAAKMLGISPQTVCEWVKELGGMKHVKAVFAAQNSKQLRSAGEYVAFMGSNDKYKHLYPVLLEGYRDFRTPKP